MDDGSPALEVGFAIDTNGSFDELLQLQSIMDTTEARVVADAAKIEKATSGMVKLAGASTAMTSFGNAHSREAQNIIQDRKRIEKSGERLVAQLERQNAAFGKTRDEMRQMRVEEAALAAERTGNTDLANRLRAQERALWDQEFVAQRKARLEADAAAEDKSIAADKAVKDAEREAQAVREAADAYRLFEAVAKQRMGAFRADEADAALREAEAVREAAQAHQLFEAAARKGMAVLRDQQATEAAAATEAERLAAAAERLKASIDPAYAAQQRFDGEMGRAKQLVAAGAVSLDDYCAKLRVEQALLTRSTVAHQDLGQAQRFTAAETLNLSRQFQDIGVTAAMGMNPLMILVQQGPQIYDVLEQAKTRGINAAAAMKQMGADVLGYAVTGFGKLATFITPANILLAGTAVTVVAVVRALGTYDAAMHRFEVTAAGLGRTSGQTAEQLEAVSEAAARAGQRSLGTTRDSVNAFAEAGVQGGQTLTLLAANVERYAKLTGQDVPAAQASLAEAMKDPARAAETFTQQLGLLTGAQYEHIRQLAAQGDQDLATAELTKILTADLAANSAQTTGLAHYMDLLGGAVSGVAGMFGRLDQRIKAAGASYDAWLKQHVGGWAVDLIGTGNKTAPAPNAAASRNQDQVAALNASQSMNTEGMKQYNDLLAQQRLLQKGLADTTGLTSAQTQALRHDYSAVTDTINANRNASGQWITTQERAHMVAQAQAKLAAAHTQAEKAAAQQQVTRLQLGTQVLTQQERQTQAQDAYNKVADKYVKPKSDHHAETLAREAEATEAQTRNLYKLADAYQVSGAEALIAEARVKAESQAIKQQGDIEAAVARQVALSIAQRVSDAEKGAAVVRDQARIQAEVNGEVAAGNISSERAAELVQQRIAELPILQAIEAAQQLGLKDAAEKATKALRDQRAAQTATKAASYGRLSNEDEAQTARTLATLREEAQLVGATDAVRARALATIKATQEAQSRYGSTTNAFATTYIAGQVAIADQTEKNRQAQQLYNDTLTFTADKWDIIAGKVQSAAQGMSEAFGSVGAAVGNLASIYADFSASRERADVEHRKALKAANGNETLVAQENAKFALRSSGAQIAAYGDMASAAKGFFKEGSAGYKALAAAEKVYRVAQLAMSLQSMVQSALETTTRVAGSTAVATAEGTAGIAAQSKLPFPANIAAMAATGAALVAAGIAVFGGGGGAKAAPVTNTGTGTVLGDPKAQSESIKNAIATLKDVDDATLTVSRGMLASLRSIESNIGGLATLLVRNGDISADSTVAQGFKANAIGSVLGNIPLIGGFLKGLFGTKTTVIGSGLYGGAQSVGDILNSGFDASYYSDVQKKKKFLGITTSTKYSTNYTGADADIEAQFALLIRQFYTTIGQAAGPLGQSLKDVQDKLLGLTINIGKIDLQGLTGDQIAEKLSAVFGAAADQMAATAFPGVERFQKVGEGTFETLVRVASTVEQVDATFRKLGVTTTSLGIDVDMAIADMFDSVSDFTNLAGTYFDDYYTKAEQTAAATASITRALDDLGLSMPTSLAGYRALVEAQDLATDAGRQTYVALLQLAPAFSDLQTSLLGAKSAADIGSERQDLETKLLQLTGDTAALRAAELAKLDPSNRALQERIYALTNEQAVAQAAAAAETQLAQQREAVVQQRTGLQQQLWQAEGNTVALRRAELEALDPANRGLQEAIWRWQDAAAASQAAAQSESELAQQRVAIEQQRAGLQQQLWQEEGNTVAIRQAELAALDPLNRGLQEAIWRWQDGRTAAEQAAQAAQTLAAAEQAIAQERTSLEGQLLQLQGDTAALRQRELAALDPSNRALQERIYALTDEQAATVAATQAAQDAAAAQQAIQQEREGLTRELLELQGDTAALRAIELAGLNEANRALQQQIYALQDAQEAAKAADALREAWQSVGDTIMEEVKRIRGLSETAGSGGFASIMGQFNAATLAARGGDQDAAKNLPDLSKSLLDAAALSATSRQELDRVRAETAASLEVTYGVIAALTGLTPSSSGDTAATAAQATSGSSAANDDLGAELRALREEVAAMRQDNNKGHATTAGNTGRTMRMIENVTQQSGGDAIATVAAA